MKTLLTIAQTRDGASSCTNARVAHRLHALSNEVEVVVRVFVERRAGELETLLRVVKGTAVTRVDHEAVAVVLLARGLGHVE